MKKRQFLAQGGALASGVVAGPWLAASAQAQADRAAAPMPTSTHLDDSALRAWQARLDERFAVVSLLGREVVLRLAEVDALTQAGDEIGVEQFRLSFEGPRHLPLAEGLHTLQAANGAQAHLHLQPVRSAAGLRYLAHFSLLA